MPQDPSFSGDNASYIDATYLAWLADPQSVSPEWRAMFEAEGAHDGVNGFKLTPSFRPASLFAGTATATVADPTATLRQMRADALVTAWRDRGHLDADTNPLGRVPADVPVLQPGYHGLSEADMDAQVVNPGVFGEPATTSPRRLLTRLRAAWAGKIGTEAHAIVDEHQRRWVQERVETAVGTAVLDAEGAARFVRKIADAEAFESMLQSRFVGVKRFSIEGGDAVIPLLDVLLDELGGRGVDEVVIGMAHRGRLNVLANTLEKPVDYIVSEFQDAPKQSVEGSGDVKYHLGFNSDTVTRRGHTVHMSLTPNPSHLETVDPVVQGKVRARQDRMGDTKGDRIVPVLIHGDAAFIGQGVVAECFNFSELAGYRTGGTIHVVVNNQIGFTTSPSDARSTAYCTDVAKILGIPVFHVNGEDAEALALAGRIAAEWRQTFHRDVVIDIVCYRKYGHNEGDEPSYTQPLMYDLIRGRQSPRANVTAALVAQGRLTAEEGEKLFAESRSAMETAQEGDVVPAATSPFNSLWKRHVGADPHAEIDTTVPVDRIRELLTIANTVPADVAAHAKLKKVLGERLDMVAGNRPIDWAVGEQAAYATLLAQGVRVRLSGQDTARGTFSHRHAVITDVKTNVEYFPLRHLSADQAAFDVYDSPLSEYSVLGFDFGWSWDMPEALVIWEAQFGDFVNGAQIILDQYIVSAEQKWGRLSGLVMMLPHGYEGQGPEHSSARIERLLQLCAEDNIQVANVTTPANLFHLLRRQVLRDARKPLVIATPKGLLRDPLATSALDELATGGFERLIDDPFVTDPAAVRRVVFCSGKVWTELHKARGDARDVAIVRIELLYPFPADLVAKILGRYANAELVWCQEEPKNQGAWPMFDEWLSEACAPRPVRYVGRKPAASPATGSKKRSDLQQKELVASALSNP